MHDSHKHDVDIERIELRSLEGGKWRRRLWKLITHPTHILKILRNRWAGETRTIGWDARANDLGAYSVIDTRHRPEEYEYVTQRQKEILYPLFRKELTGSEKRLLDFGCGPGRFTGDLAEIIKGTAVGTDVTSRLIELAPNHPLVQFVYSKNFLAENSEQFDAIWICLVLGGIPDADLLSVASGLEKSLRVGGLLFLVESTADSPRESVWRVRTIEQLVALFPGISLERVGGYVDAGQEISVLAGRKK